MWVTKLLISPVKKKDFLPKFGIFGQFGPGHAGLFSTLLWVGWWLCLKCNSLWCFAWVDVKIPGGIEIFAWTRPCVKSQDGPCPLCRDSVTRIMGNGEELCLLCDLPLTRCGLRVAVEKKAKNFATPGFFYPKSDIVGLSGGGLWPCRCILNNCYYFHHPCFIRFLGSYIHIGMC